MKFGEGIGGSPGDSTSGVDAGGTDVGAADLGLGTTVGSVKAVVRAASLEVADLDPALVPLPDVIAMMDAFAALERLGAAGRVLLTKRAAEAGEWKRSGYSTPEEWLAAKQGTSRGRARADLGTSSKLSELDATADAMREGRLSPEQAGAVSGAASVNPDAEADLLGLAERDSLKGLQEEAARRKAEREDPAEKEEAIRRNRSCRTWTRDGEWHLRANGPAADAAGFTKDLEALIFARFTAARKEQARGEWEGRDAYAFDALVGAGMNKATAGADSDGRQPTGSDAQESLFDSGDGVLGGRPGLDKGNRRVKHLALLRVDLAALVRGNVVDGELCEIAGFGPVSVPAARNLLGESLLKLVLTDGVDVVNVTHAGRGPRIAQEIALLWAQPKCCVSGCDNNRMLEVDHRVRFVDERVTELPNLNRPCSHHHDLKTYEGWDFARERAPDGRLYLVAPDDPRHPRHPCRDDTS